MWSLIRDLSYKLWKIATVNYSCRLSDNKPFRKKIMKLSDTQLWVSLPSWIIIQSSFKTSRTVGKSWWSWDQAWSYLTILSEFFGCYFTPGIFLSNKFPGHFRLQSIAHCYQGPGSINYLLSVLGQNSPKLVELAKASSSKVVLLVKSIEIA